MSRFIACMYFLLIVDTWSEVLEIFIHILYDFFFHDIQGFLFFFNLNKNIGHTEVGNPSTCVCFIIRWLSQDSINISILNWKSVQLNLWISQIFFRVKCILGIVNKMFTELVLFVCTHRVVCNGFLFYWSRHLNH